MIELRVVEDSSALVGLEPEWYELLAHSDANEPMLTPLWLMAWWAVFGRSGGRRLRTCLIREGGQLIGLVPLLARDHRYRRLLRFRRLELVGSGEDEADEIVSDYIGPIVARGYEALVANAVADAIAAGRLGAWDELVCPRMAAWRGSVQQLERALAERGAVATLRRTGECRFIQLPATWDAYLGGLAKKHRYSIRHAMREFENWAGKDQKLETATSHAELARGIEILRALHDQRWRAKNRTGVFASNRFRKFHALVMPQLLERGALQLVWLTVRGDPIAALYNIVWNRNVYVYQGGRRMDLPKQVRPGIALHAIVVRRAIEHGLAEYDFLAGDSLYKAQLGTHTRQLVELRATASRSLREATRQFAEKGIGSLRALERVIRRPHAGVRGQERR